MGPNILYTFIECQFFFTTENVCYIELTGDFVEFSVCGFLHSTRTRPNGQDRR